MSAKKARAVTPHPGASPPSVVRRAWYFGAVDPTSSRPGHSVGHRLGRYELLVELERDEIASVWIGRYGSALACVRILDHRAGAALEIRTAFLGEARAARGVKHPRFERVLDAGTDHSETFLATEYAEGLTLDELIAAAAERGTLLPCGVVLRIGLDLLGPLAALHEVNVPGAASGTLLHGDLTPRAVSITPNAETRLLPTCTGAIARLGLGSGSRLAYKAPEQLQQRAGVDPRADLFAFAVVLWEALAGRRLFGAGEPGEIVSAVLAAPIPDLSELRTEAPSGIAVALGRALERDPAKRPRDVAELRATFEAAASGAIADAAQLAEAVREFGGSRLEQRRAVLSERLAASPGRSAPLPVPDVERAWSSAPPPPPRVVSRPPAPMPPRPVAKPFPQLEPMSSPISVQPISDPEPLTLRRPTSAQWISSPEPISVPPISTPDPISEPEPISVQPFSGSPSAPPPPSGPLAEPTPLAALPTPAATSKAAAVAPPKPRQSPLPGSHPRLELDALKVVTPASGTQLPLAAQQPEPLVSPQPIAPELAPIAAERTELTQDAASEMRPVGAGRLRLAITAAVAVVAGIAVGVGMRGRPAEQRASPRAAESEARVVPPPSVAQRSAVRPEPTPATPNPSPPEPTPPATPSPSAAAEPPPEATASPARPAAPPGSPIGLPRPVVPQRVPAPPHAAAVAKPAAPDPTTRPPAKPPKKLGVLTEL